MKRAVLVANNVIRIEEAILPKPTGNLVKVKVISCGICGSDIPRYFFNGAHFYPLVLGHEFCGEVLEVGEKVKSLKKNDHVVGIPLKPCFECEDCKKGDYSLCKNYKFYGSSLDGAFAEEILIEESNLFKISSSIASKYCALFEPSTVALHGIKMYDNLKGKTVAVLGGGTIAQFIGVWAKIYGAKKVVMFVINHDNDEIYKKLDLTSIELSNDEGIKKAVSEYTNAKGFDFVFDGAGVNATIINSLKLVGNHGNICLIGTPAKDLSFTKKEWETINRKEASLRGTWMSYSENWPGDEWRETLRALESGKLVLDNSFFAGEFPLEKINDAFEFIKQGKKGKEGRVLIVM